MRIKTSLSDEQLKSGFTAENDIFHKKDLALRLTSLLTSLEHGSVSLLEGRWGIGKSTFAKMWVAHLQNVGISSIYFDAFAADYIENPFQAVSSAFIRAAQEAKQTHTPAYQRFLDSAAKVGKAVASTTAKVGVKALTLGLIGSAEIGQITSIKDDLAGALGDVSEASIKKLLEGHAEAEASFSALRASLAELPTLLTSDTAEPSTGEASAAIKPLIVVIDELDRCRPDFALGILETLKHFFRSECIHFVLVTNETHLALSVARRYGLGAAASEYLQKFYDFTVHFDQQYDRYQEGSAALYVGRLMRDLFPQGQEDSRNVTEYLEAIARAYELSLRQIENIVTNVVLSYLSVTTREFKPAILISFLSVLKSLKPEIFKSAKASRFDLPALAEFLKSGNWKDTFDYERVLTIFQYYSDPQLDVNSDEWRGFSSSTFSFNIDRLRVLPYLANSVVDRFGRV